MARFTAQNAKAMAERSHVPGVKRYGGMENRAARLAFNAEVFRLKSINRVRRQLVKLFMAIDSETDPARIDKLASAISRLTEIERVQVGRPMPGSLRPITERRSSANIEPPTPTESDC